MKLDRAELNRGAFDPAELGLCELELRKYRDAPEHLTWSLERDYTLPTATTGAVLLLRAHVVHTDLRERHAVRREHGWTSHTCRDARAPAACADIQGQVNERNLFATLGKVSLGTSAVFGVATAASFLTEVAVFGAPPEATGVRVVPITTSQQAGVLLEGAW
ncbi:hypothetical protein [Sorangium sp. So ce1389]|uniref:hypothetical protein n=1 Tax=Sorangium sp. So ce1389 TaxID=3133336 RepID=UPI003F61FB2C